MGPRPGHVWELAQGRLLSGDGGHAFLAPWLPAVSFGGLGMTLSAGSQ